MPERAFRSILTTYSGPSDDAALELATELARASRGWLHIVVPIPPLSRFCHLGYAAGVLQREELECGAADTARGAVARVPDDVAVLSRCLPVAAIPTLMEAIDAHAYDLCVARGSRWPGFYGTRVALATVRRARRAGLPTFVVREPGRRPLALPADGSAGYAAQASTRATT